MHVRIPKVVTGVLCNRAQDGMKTGKTLAGKAACVYAGNARCVYTDFWLDKIKLRHTWDLGPLFISVGR